MSKRIARLDGLRAVAILGVFMRHALDVRLTWIGLDVFFVLSGFLITGILLDMPKTDFRAYLGQFYARRARRILPPLALLLVVGSIVFGLGWTRHWYMYLGLANYTFFFADGSFPPFDALWSLAVEEQFYFVWPLVVFWLSPKRLPAVLIVTILTAPLLRGLASHLVANQSWNENQWFVYRGTPFRMDCLAMGGLLTFVWRRHEDNIRRHGYLGLGAACLALFFIVVLDHVFGGFSTVSGTVRGSVVTLELTLLTATGLFLWALGGRFTGILIVSPVRFLGKVSYSFYLIHWSFILLAQRYLHQRYGVALASFAATVAYASASWYLMEEPILAGGSRRSKLEETHRVIMRVRRSSRTFL